MKKIQVLAVSTAVMLTLGACTNTLQDGVEGASGGWFSESSEEEGDQSIPGEDEEFPAVGAVPERPEEPEIKQDYETLQSGLVADNQNAQYSDQVIRSQSIPQNETPIPAPAPAPAEVAVPSEPPVASDSTATAAAAVAPLAVEESAAAPSPAPAPTPVEPKITSEGAESVAVPAAPAAATVAANSATEGQPKIYTPAEGEAVPQAAEPAPVAEPQQVAEETPAPVEPAPAPTPAEPAAEEVVVKPTPVAQDTQAGAVLDVPNVQASQEAVAAITANRAEEAASNGTHIATLYYSVGNAVLSANDKSVLAQVADLYAQNGGNGVAVIGHASIPVSPHVTNPALVNYKVSLDRAVNVTEVLGALGIPADLILMDARGANSPVRVGDTDLDHAYNRRTEIYFLN